MTGKYVDAADIILEEMLSQTTKGSVPGFPCLITEFCKAKGVPGIPGTENPMGALNSIAARTIMGNAEAREHRGREGNVAAEEAEDPAEEGTGGPAAQAAPTDFCAYFEQMSAQFCDWAGPHYTHIE